MITSLMLDKMVPVTMNGSKDITVNGHDLRVDKDIPFIRYRFDDIGAEELEYVEMMQSVFTKSVHLLEITLDENTEEVIDRINNSGLSAARFLYWHITDNMCENPEKAVLEHMPLFVKVINSIDGIIFYDDTSILDMVTYRKFVGSLQATAIGRHDEFYGLCNSPFSCSEFACLTAVKARSLQAKYCTDVDVPLPTSNHQDNPTCGCIRHLIVNDPIVGVVKAAKVKKETVKKEAAPKKEKEVKKKEKKGFIPYGGMF